MRTNDPVLRKSEEEAMRKILAGQILLILCCVFYLIWWYRGYRPGTPANRLEGANGVLFWITAALGIAGLTGSLGRIEKKTEPPLAAHTVLIIGVVAYIVLLLITRTVFRRPVTTELILIVGWTVLEISVINRLSAAGNLSGRGFAVLCALIALAFTVSIVLYVAYYRMEEMKAFYAAMIPLVTEAAAMAAVASILIGQIH